MKKKIYIAGKVTGEPKHTTALKFATAKKEIEALGFEAINPIEVVGDWNAPWELAMRKCIAALMECDGVVVLPDFGNSKGAMIEHDLANSLGMPVWTSTEIGHEFLSAYKWNN